MFRLPLLSFLLLAFSASAQTVLTAVSARTARLHTGAAITATLVEPAYDGTRMVLPSRTTLHGHIVQLTEDHAKRARGRWNLDFTLWSEAKVVFEEAVLPDGSAVPLRSAPATGAAAAVSAHASGGARHGNFVSRQCKAVLGTVRSTIAFFLAPGRGDRLRDLALHQLPWHPQWVNAGTAWQVRLNAPLTLAGSDVALADSSELAVTLDSALTSATARAGNAVTATVQSPARALGEVIPQGTRLIGHITEAAPAGNFAHSGRLRFAFDRVRFADGREQPWGAQLTGVTTSGQDRVAIDREGGVTPAPEDRFVVPVVLVVLAASPLTPDPGDNDEFVKNAGASNGLGAAGFALGVGVNSANLAAGLGFYSAAVSTGYRWLGHGRDVVFPENTRMEIRLNATP